MTEWTTTAPTEPGYYWWRIDKRMEVCRVVDGGRLDQEVAFEFPGDQTAYMANALVGEFWPEAITAPRRPGPE